MLKDMRSKSVLVLLGINRQQPAETISRGLGLSAELPKSLKQPPRCCLCGIALQRGSCSLFRRQPSFLTLVHESSLLKKTEIFDTAHPQYEPHVRYI